MMSWSKAALVCIAIVFTYIVFNLASWKSRHMLGMDEAGYYIYLPATFIYHDVGHLAFYPQMEAKYNLSNGVKWYAIYDEPGGFKLNKYPLGTAIFELPFFFAAHIVCLLQPATYPPDGYSAPYLLGVALAPLFWVLAGLVMLCRFLRHYCSDIVTALTLLLLAFGTNLFFYTVFTSGMSHPVSFALVCFLLFYTRRWYAGERVSDVLFIGLIIGLIVITRPTNAVVALIPLCWQYKEGRLSDKLAFFRRQFLPVVSAGIICLLVIMLQLSYWKLVTGSWLSFSYKEEGFNFLSPQVWNGLFSYRKGWFVYTPLALIGVIGLIPLARTYKKMAAIILLYFAVNIYIVFSWCNWPYGSSFGCRALIESLAVLALPLALLIQWIFAGRKKVFNAGMLTLFCCIVALNLFQSVQLLHNVVPWDGVNKAFYWRAFANPDIKEEDKKLLSQ